MPVSGEGLRARKKRETRSALHAAALRLMRDEAPGQVTVEAICREADVSRRTFFNYFDTKEDAFFAWDSAAEAEVIEAVVRAPASATPALAVDEAVRRVFRRVLHDERWHDQQSILRSHPDLMAAGLRLTGELENTLALGLARRLDRTTEDLEVQTLAALAVTAARVVARRWRADPGADLDDLFDQVFAIATNSAPAQG